MKKKKIFQFLAIMMAVLLVSGTFSAEVFGSQGQEQGESISGNIFDETENPGTEDGIEEAENLSPDEADAVGAAKELISEEGAETADDNSLDEADAVGAAKELILEEGAETADDNSPDDVDAGGSIPEETSPSPANVEAEGDSDHVSEERQNEILPLEHVIIRTINNIMPPQPFGVESIVLIAQPTTSGRGQLYYTFYIVNHSGVLERLTNEMPSNTYRWTPRHVGHHLIYAMVRDSGDNNKTIKSEELDFIIEPAPLATRNLYVTNHLIYGQKLSEAVFSDAEFRAGTQPDVPVTGTLSFDEPDLILPVGTHTVQVTFTPDSENYLTFHDNISVTVDPCEHDVGVNIVGDKEPTCTEAGATGQKVCARCGEVLEESTEIQANGHSWDGGTVTKEPTVEQEGIREYRCTVEGCDGKRTEYIPKLEAVNEAVSVKGAVITGVVDKTYNGSAQTQNPLVKIGDRTLTKGTDYNITYTNNKNAGTATMTITGTGNYKETVSTTFKIAKAAQNFTVKAAASAIDAGKTTKVTVSGAKENPAFTFTSSNTSVATVNSSGTVTGKAAGTVTITVKAAATANYTVGTKTVKITVNKVLKKPGNCNFAKWNNAKYTSCRIAWNKVDGAEGYQTLLSWTDGSHASQTIVKSNVLYRNCTVHPQHVSQMMVRAFYTAGGVRKYGPWSNVAFITPSPATLTSKNASSGTNLKMNISWNIIYGCNGYNVFLTTNPNGTWYWNQSTSESAGSTSAVITKYRGSKLKKNTRYYVRIVTRRKRNGVFCTVPMPANNTNIGSFVIK